MRIRNTYLVLSCLTVALIGFLQNSNGQSVSFKASAPKVLRAGEQFQLVYSINQRVDDFTPPDFGEFQYIQGPAQGSSTSISMVNGKTTRVSNYTFTYYLQAPNKGGNYTLAPATASHKRNTIQSNSLSFEVVGQGSSGSSSAGSSNSSAQSGTAANPSTSSGDDIFVRLEVDKKSAYVGEQITAWVKLYTKVNLAGIDQQFKGPEFIGFYRQDIDIPAIRNLERQRVGDEIYGTGILQKVLLYPQKSGEIVIEPFDLLVEVQTQSRRRPQSIFDDFFGSQYDRKRINLKSNKVKLNIRALPGNQPADFSGAVGKFSINATTNTNDIRTNDAATFKVKVSGQGNVKLIDKLATNFPPTFDVFDPVKKVQTDAGSEGKSGSVTFEYTAIPRHAGTFTVPPFSLIYFDPSTGTYKTISTKSFGINVTKGDGDSTTVISGNLSKEDVELLGSDIRYIETQSNIKPKNIFIFGRPWFFIIFISSFVLFLLILIVRKEQLRRSADIVKYRNRKAGRVATKRLRTASKLLKSDNISKFYEELERALWGFLSDKLNIPVAELSAESAEAKLGENNLDEAIRKEFIDIINTCQFARYAPGGMESKMPDLFDRTSAIISRIDQKL